jgi:4-hydroxy-tetrahydrodipicolinate synthase
MAKKALRLEGLIVPMATPFKKNGELDEDGLGRFTKWLISQGVHGLYPIGGCGEAPKLSVAEKMRIIDVVTEEAHRKVPVLPCTSQGSLIETIELSKYAKEKGCEGIVIIPPNFWWIKITDENVVFDYFKRLTDEVSSPVIVYDNGVNMPVSLIGKLLEIESIVGLKDSSNDSMKLVTEIAMFKKRIAIFPGEEHMLLPSLLLGAAGAVCSCLNVCPKLIVDIYDDFRGGRLKEARNLHDSLIPLWNAIYEYDEHHAIKQALAMMGMPIGDPRIPYFRPPLPESKLKELRRLLVSAGLLQKDGRADREGKREGAESRRESSLPSEKPMAL